MKSYVSKFVIVLLFVPQRLSGRNSDKTQSIWCIFQTYIFVYGAAQVEEERNIVRQTAFAAEAHTSRRNHLSARSDNLNHSIRPKSRKGNINLDSMKKL